MNGEKRWNIRLSHVLFGVAALSAILFGVLYLVWPIAPYHEEIIGMTFNELKSLDAEVAGLMRTLADVVGLSFLGIGAFLAYTGEKAWRDRWARAVIAAVLLVFVVPMVVVVHLAGGPTAVMAAVGVIVAAGLAAAHLGR